MTFWKVSDTRIGCRITMQEIKDMGFEFQELSKERQKTAEFLGRILESARDALKIELPDGVQSFTAQVLPDQSLLLVISADTSTGRLTGTWRFWKTGFLP